MNKEISVGAIIYKLENKQKMFLLVYSQRNKEWGFAKGHIEYNETEKQTATREVLEETGIDNITFIDGFREVDIYKIEGTLPQTKGKIVEKQSIYYLCLTDKSFTKSKDDEISKYSWCNYNEALSLLKYNKQKEILTKANLYLGGTK